MATKKELEEELKRTKSTAVVTDKQPDGSFSVTGGNKNGAFYTDKYRVSLGEGEGNPQPYTPTPVTPTATVTPKSGSTGSGGSGSTSPSLPELPNVGDDAKIGAYGYNAYDPATDAAYQNALASLNAQKAQLPNYKGSYDSDLASAYADITGRDPFSYDLDADMLYQQYRQQYVEGGRLAMMDTMGQAAALTGGYGSTYAQSVGQQQYDAYLQRLNDVIPQLYDRAYERYKDEGDELSERYSLVRDLADIEYDRYRDTVADHRAALEDAREGEQLAYERGFKANETEYARGLAANERAYDRQQNEYNRLLGLMTNIGYTPSESDMRAAGMTTAEAQAWQKYVAAQNAASSYSGGGSTGNVSLGSKANGLLAAYTADKSKALTGTKIADQLSYQVNAGNITVDEAREIARQLDQQGRV